MRPIIGAAAAGAVLVIIEANHVLSFINLGALEDPRALLVLGLLAGYSDRFLTGTFDRLSEVVGEKK
jgi:hypothetical protein